MDNENSPPKKNPELTPLSEANFEDYDEPLPFIIYFILAFMGWVITLTNFKSYGFFRLPPLFLICLFLGGIKHWLRSFMYTIGAHLVAAPVAVFVIILAVCTK